MITKEANKIIDENDEWVIYQFNTPIYDNKGYFTHDYDDSNPDIISVRKGPKEWNLS